MGASTSTAARKRQRRHTLHRGVRWAIQIVFFILAPTLWSAGFSGLKTIFNAIGATAAVEFSSFIMLFVTLLAFTIVFGRFFCGYACSFGTLGDAVYALFTPVRRALHIPHNFLPGKVQRTLQWVKYLILVVICAACWADVWSSVSPYSPWTTFGALINFSVADVTVLAAALFVPIIVGMAFIDRFFCQFLCPFGATFALMPALPFASYRRKKHWCLQRCDRCQAACPVAMHPDPDELFGGECISCGACCDVCPAANVAMVRVALPKGASAAAGSEGAGADDTLGAAAAGSTVPVADASTAAIAAADADAATITGADGTTAGTGDVAATTKASAGAKCARHTQHARHTQRPKQLHGFFASWHGGVFRIDGNGVVSAVAKAALLLLMCWYLGALNYVPDFTSVFPFFAS